MEKYRIIERDIKNKTILLESTDGRTVVVNEGVFKDTFIKMRDAFVKFVKRGNRIVAKIGGKLTNSINSIYNTLLNKQKYAHVFLSKNDTQTASEIGVENENAEFERFVQESLNENNINAACEILQGLQYQAKRCLTMLENRGDKIEEAWNPDYKLNQDTYKTMYPNISSEAYPENDETNKEHKYAEFVKGVNKKHNYQLEFPDLKIDTDYDIIDVTNDKLIRLLDRSARKIFSNEWDGDIHNNIRKGDEYKPYVIYGASGIGKTSIIHQLRAQYGVSMIVLSGNYMNEYSLSSPTTTSVKLYKVDKDGTEIFGEDGEPLVIGERTGVDTVLSTTIPGFDIEKTVADARNEISRRGEVSNEEVKKYIADRVAECDRALGKGILFIDEITRMPAGLMDSLMNLFDTGKIGNQKLGTNWMIVGALNPAFKRGENLIKANLESLQEESRARRIKRVNFIPTFENFIAYGKGADKTGKTRLHPLVIKFLDNSVRQYHMMNVFLEVPKVEYKGTISSPALWEGLSEAIYLIDEDYGGNPSVSKDINILKTYIDDILEQVDINMPYERLDVEEYLRSELLEMSDDICREAWDREPGTDVKNREGETFVNSAVNKGRGISFSTDEIVNKLYNNAPFVEKGKVNKEKFEANRKKYLLNIFNFVRTFFDTGDSRAKTVLRQLLMERLPKMYETPKSEGTFSDLVGKDNMADKDYADLFKFLK